MTKRFTRDRRLDLTLVAVGCVAFALLGALSVPGCVESSSSSTQSEPRAERGAVAGPRIVALLPFAADQLLAMGVTPLAVPQLAGDVPPAWAGLPTVTVDHSAGPNVEQLISHSPDVVITSSVYAQFVRGIETGTGSEVVIIDIDSIGDVLESIERLGEIAGVPDRAGSLAERVRRDLGSAWESEPDIDVLAIFGTPHAFYAFLPDSYLGDLVEHSGGRFITDGMVEHSVFRGLAPLSMEVVIDRDPDQLLVLFHGPQESAQAMLDRDPLWSELSAVKNGDVTFLQDDLYAMRPGSELGRAIADIRGIMQRARASKP